jgi:hypothetical protein
MKAQIRNDLSVALRKVGNVKREYLIEKQNINQNPSSQAFILPQHSPASVLSLEPQSGHRLPPQW